MPSIYDITLLILYDVVCHLTLVLNNINLMKSCDISPTHFFNSLFDLFYSDFMSLSSNLSVISSCCLDLVQSAASLKYHLECCLTEIPCLGYITWYYTQSPYTDIGMTSSSSSLISSYWVPSKRASSTVSILQLPSHKADSTNRTTVRVLFLI